MVDIIHYFKEIPGWEGLYIVSTDGKVASLQHRFGKRNSPRLCRPVLSNNGYYRVRLSRNNKITFLSIHRAVAMAFIGGIPHGMCVRHLDGNKKHNNLNNLAIGTALENSNDEVVAKRHPHGATHPRSKLSDKDVLRIRKYHSDGIPQIMIAKMFRIDQTHVSKIIRRELWKHI